MKIKGIEGMSDADIQREIERGGKFVIYQYCVSILILTFKRPSSVYFIPGGESAVGKGLKYTILSAIFGWWGFPWGPIYTIGSLVTNFGGGKDVTADLVRQTHSPQ